MGAEGGAKSRYMDDKAEVNPKVATTKELKKVRHAQSKLLNVFAATSFIDHWDGASDLKKGAVPYKGSGSRMPELSRHRDLPGPPKTKDGDEPTGPAPKQWRMTHPARAGRGNDSYFAPPVGLPTKGVPKHDPNDKEAWAKARTKMVDQYADKLTFTQAAVDRLRKKDDGVSLADVFHGDRRTEFQQEMKHFRGGAKERVGDDLVPVPGALRGFLSSDWAKRDEFTLDFRTEQYREQLRREDKHSRAAIAAMAAAGGEDVAAAEPAPPADKTDPAALYDLVFTVPQSAAAAGGDRWTRTGRDTLNPTRLTRERNLGSFRTTSAEHFPPPPADLLRRPDHGIRSLIQDTFYRKDGGLQQ